VDPRAGMDRCGKSRPPPGFDPRTVQPVASRYTDYATLPTVIYIPFRKPETDSHILTTSNTNFDNQKGNIKFFVYILRVNHVVFFNVISY
jgi:hypothetical protein